MAQFPDTASALVDELAKMFPERPSSPESGREDDLHYGGKRALILFLAEWRDRSRRDRSERTARSVRR